MSDNAKRCPRARLPVLAGGLLAAGAALLGGGGVLAQGGGRSVYDVKCAPCHATGLLGSPKLGNADDWRPRLAKGRDVLVEHAKKGFGKMPPRGGNPTLADADVEAAVEYMIAQAGGTGSRAAAGPPAGAAQARAAEPPAAPTPRAPASPAAKAPATRAPAPKPRTVRVQAAPTSGPNAFNRLMRPPSKRNPPPAKDGIHDPQNPGTGILQPPREAFKPLPRGRSGNYVDWVRALGSGKIAPRYDLHDPDAKPVVMDLNIVREVKGSMPDVVYPHKQHTQWLDCSNCHPAIFVPQKGANQISMAGILLGKQCGVCHGKVAFPISECRRCHSRNKPKTAAGP